MKIIYIYIYNYPYSGPSLRAAYSISGSGAYPLPGLVSNWLGLPTFSALTVMTSSSPARENNRRGSCPYLSLSRSCCLPSSPMAAVDGDESSGRFFVAVHVGAGYHAPSNEKALRSAMKRACLAAASILKVPSSFSLTYGLAGWRTDGGLHLVGIRFIGNKCNCLNLLIVWLDKLQDCMSCLWCFLSRCSYPCYCFSFLFVVFWLLGFWWMSRCCFSGHYCAGGIV